MRCPMLLCACLLASGVAPIASAGVLEGTVHVPGVVASTPSLNAYPGRASAMPGCKMPPRGQVGDAVVYLVRIPAAAETTLAASPQPRPRLAQRDQCFVPRVVVVAVGGTVDFPNMDPIYHNVFSVSPTRRFDLGKYPKGQSKAVTFKHAGLVNVYCDIHSDMAAFVLVVPNHAYVQPTADGSFTLPELPGGRYELHVWHPDFPEFTREVEVPASGQREVEVEL